MSTKLIHIEKITLKNTYYRNVIQTTKTQQLVLMSLPPGDTIEKEKHNGSQFFRVEKGIMKIIINKHKYVLKDGDCIIVPPHTDHEVFNQSNKHHLKLYTIYSPPVHKPGTKSKHHPEND